MKIKFLTSLILSFALLQSSNASPLLHILGSTASHIFPYAITQQHTQSPEYKAIHILNLRLDAQNLADAGQYDEALAKLDKAEAMQLALGDKNQFGDMLFQDARLKLLEGKTRHLIKNQQFDEAKITSQQSDVVGKMYAMSSESHAMDFYNIAHEMNQTAYAFADEAKAPEFAAAKRAQIQATFDAILAKHPELSQYFAYNNACLAAQRGDTQRTIALLNLANQNKGYLSRSMIDGDRDFDNVRQQPEFQTWLKQTFAAKKVKKKK